MNQGTFNWVRGDSQLLHLTITHDGEAVNITGWTIYFTAKINLNDPDSEAVISVTQTTHTEPTEGKTDIAIAAATTKNLLGNYYYDIRSKDTGGNIRTLEKGQLNFVKDATRRALP